MGLWFASTRASGLTRSARLPLAGLALILGLVFGAMTFGANVNHLVDEPRLYGENFDLAIGAGGEVTRQDIAPLVSGPGLSKDVEAVTLYGSTTATTGTVSFPLIGMDPVRGRLVPDVLTGQLPAAPDEIALGPKTAERLDVEVGDTFRVRTRAGARGGGTRTLTVTGLAQPPPVGSADRVGDAGLVTRSGLQRIAPGTPALTAAVNLRPGAGADTRRRIARRLGMGAGLGDPPAAIVNVRRVRHIPYLVAALVGALAALSLGHQMLVAVRQRRVDLAILRALGATRGWLSRVVHWQATIITVAVLAIGTLLGISAGNSIYRAFVARTGARADIVIPFGWILAIGLLLLILAHVAAAVSRFRASDRAHRALPWSW